jgi:Pup amidohydrolase
VLEALIRDPDRIFPTLCDPLQTLPAISRDPSFRWELRLADGTPSTALAVQREYLKAARELCDLENPSKAALIKDWEQVLSDLESDHLLCRNRLDWVAKLALVRDFQNSQNLSDDDPWLQSLDLEYHRLSLEEGLYYGLEQSGAMIGAPDEALVHRAMTEPPPSTRARVRGLCIQKFPDAIVSAQWDHVTLQGSEGNIRISLLDLFSPEEIEHYSAVICSARSPDDLRVISNSD